MRLIGILGTAHCGSTALTVALGNCAGVAPIGESHWMMTEDYPGPWPCHVHGPHCPTLTPDLVIGMDPSQPGWWKRIADAYEAETVISADKRPIFFDKLGHPDRAIILYRDPVCWSWSWSRRNPDLSIEDSGKVWAAAYARILAWVEKHGIPWRGLCWDAVRPAPARGLEPLCNWLGLELTGAGLELKPVCRMGGYRDAEISEIRPPEPVPAAALQARHVTLKTLRALQGAL